MISQSNPALSLRRMRHGLVLATACLTGALACSAQAYTAAAAKVPFVVQYGGAGKPVADVSFLLDAPAGKHGPIKVQGGHFVDGRGQRVRFWGVNITDWSPGSSQIPSKADAAAWADILARHGVNLVRLQFLDFPAPRGLIDAGRADTRALDPAQLDREDFFLAELRKRGIYVNFNLLVGRRWKSGDGVADVDALAHGAKSVTMYDQKMIALQKEYASELLGHRNPYTGLTYAEDPAIAFIEINNENAVFVGYKAPSAFYADELDGLYNTWLSLHRPADAIARLRRAIGVAADAPVPLMQAVPSADVAGTERYAAEAEFYDQLQRRYFDDVRDYLHSGLGVKSMIVGTADHNHNASGYPIIRANRGMDAIDAHDYWLHPIYHDVKTPMVNEPERSVVADMARSAVAGKPLTVSEVNEPFPNDFGGEMMPILAAYGAFQDWDEILWYSFEPKTDLRSTGDVGDAFDISHDPVKMSELAAGAVMFLRGDIAPARQTLIRDHTGEDALKSYALTKANAPLFDPALSPDDMFEHGVRIGTLDAKASSPSALVGQAPQTLVADTGQLAWTRGPDGQVKINTARTQGLIGFTRPGMATDNLQATLTNRFACLLLTSLTADPIAASKHLLLVAGSAVENTGQVWNASGIDVSDHGHAPSIIEDVTGTIALHGLASARSVRIQPLTADGRAIGRPLRARKQAEAWQVDIGRPATTWYRIDINR